jgi:molybdopterin-containing oxidoreductase family iron-sulfur binding subunit
MKRPPLDPELLRDRLSAAQGKHYWRCLEELAGEPAFQEMLQREFPAQAGELTDPISRRRFLTLMGASLALAGLSGCTRPTGTIMPYVRQPENIVLGKPLYYATSMPLAGFAEGLLVESHEGRPTKAEGNPQHPASLGATSVFGQAAILGLYDPDRAQSVTYRGQPRGWSDVVQEMRNRLHRSDRTKGERVAVLTETIASPTLDAQLDAFLHDHPEARWFQYEPANRDQVSAGANLAFGKNHHSYFKVAKADVIVSLGADFLGSGPGHLAYTREFSSRRRVQDVKGRADPGGKEGMNRLYVLETDFTITGAKADHRLALRPTEIEGFARALAAKLDVHDTQAPPLEGEAARWAEVVAADLKRTGKGRTLVIAGDNQPPAVHALVHAINNRLGNFGSTVLFTEPLLPGRFNSMESLEKLAFAIEKGEIDTLLILGGNPAYTAPANLGFDKLLLKQLEQPRDRWLAIHLGLYFDETSRLCHWHIPEAHFLESWSDASAYDGTASIVQPLIAPLYAGRSAHEVVAALTRRKSSPRTESEYDERTPHELVRDHWRKHRPQKSAELPFERFWQQALHDGIIDGTAARTVTPTLATDLFQKAEMKPSAPEKSKGFELTFALDPAVYDGRFGNNGWLQEWPRPITRLTWDNAVLMSPATAKKLRLRDRLDQWRGGEHGDTIADVVTLRYDRRELEAAVWIVPGHADDALTLHLGYGRTHSGRVGTNVGFNANQIRRSSEPWIITGVGVTRARKKHHLACVQAHHGMAGRDIVRSGTLKQYRDDPDFSRRHDHVGHEELADGRLKRRPLPTLSGNSHEYPGYKWGMAIDLTACTGCGACVVACQAENNSPVVGKEQVLRAREMHWLRIDRYFETPKKEGEPAFDELRVHFQPLPCQHCENAPCELVCPVEATVHGSEGTNDMVYNRCVGTRYCSNNCPYKVRRFNFLQYSDYDTPSLRLMYNPEVTVRTRGVMEKCTFCIQRISYARIEAAKEALEEKDKPLAQRKRRDRNGPEGGPRLEQSMEVGYIRDGEVVTACQAACPAEAILFGDLNDKSSRVHKLHESSLRYDLLGELGVAPRVAYLASLRNPNPELESK